MNSKSIVISGVRLQAAIKKMSALEAIHKHNMLKRKILSNGGYSRAFVGAPGNMRSKPGPNEIFKACPLYSGTFGAIGASGRRLAKRLETEAEYFGKKKTLILESQGAPREVMVCCDHGFADGGIPTLHLSNAATGNQITTHKGMLEATEVILKLKGQIHSLEIQNREGGLITSAEGAATFGWISDSAAGGLLTRGYFGGWLVFGLGTRQSLRFGVVTESAAQPEATPKTQGK
jgi:hypothetical protein